MIEDDVIVRMIPLPYHIRAFTKEDCEGIYNVYINTYLTKDEQIRAFTHELEHIRNNDFASTENACAIEQRMFATSAQ